MSKLRQLRTLFRLLAGDAPADVDWMSVLALANETLVTPQIYSAALRTDHLLSLPADVRVFLHEVWRRNRERNRRLFGQLDVAVAVLNSAHIVPTLLKGAALWAIQGRPENHDRILTDLDLLVAPGEAQAAVEALELAGFAPLALVDDPASHVIAELGRPEDVGIIDLHGRAPGPARLALEALALPGQLLDIQWDGLRAKAPSPALQVFLLVLHDQFQDGGYWRGEFALRHLLDIAALSRFPGGVDWTIGEELARTRLVRNARDAQLLSAAKFCDALAPPSAGRTWVHLQHARRCAQFAWPSLNDFFRSLAG